jgi:hypothetical protein
MIVEAAGFVDLAYAATGSPCTIHRRVILQCGVFACTE